MRTHLGLLLLAAAAAEASSSNPFVSQCKKDSYDFCCALGTPCDCTKGTTSPGQCKPESYLFCCDVGKECDCSKPPVKNDQPPTIGRACSTPETSNYPFCNTKLSIADRVKDLVSKLPNDEKAKMLTARESPGGAVDRLGVPEYDWGGNCVHGVQSRCLNSTSTGGEPRCPTSFPAPNFQGASFNATSWKTVAGVIGRELRAIWLHNGAENHQNYLPHIGLDCWSPNVNLVRDPRWGRNMETPGEDPLLVGTFGSMYAQGVQNGEDKRYLQGIATLKHFVANELEGSWKGTGGPAKYPGTGQCPGGECTRHTIDVNVSAYDLVSSYLRPFRISIVDGGAQGVMCSYNSVNGFPSCANPSLLKEVLGSKWNYTGYVTSDSGAVKDVYNTHWFVASDEDAVKATLDAGCSVDSGDDYIKYAADSITAGKLSQESLDTAISQALTMRFKLGLFDPIDDQPYWHVQAEEVRSEDHLNKAMESSAQGFVLLKNQPAPKATKNALPLQEESCNMALIGPLADDKTTLLGNYLGQMCPGDDISDVSCMKSIKDALTDYVKTAEAGQKVLYSKGLPSVSSNDTSGVQAALDVAKQACQVVLVLGLDGSVEGEGHDRHSVGMPGKQEELLAQLNIQRQAMKAPYSLTVVLINGGTVSSSVVKDQADAIVEAWYPGFFGATALTNALLGENRWGRMPVTVYSESYDQVDPLNFEMAKAPGRTYRYYSEEPLWEFGAGLSYTTFSLSLRTGVKMDSVADVTVPACHPEDVPLAAGTSIFLPQMNMQNTGELDGDTVLLGFFSPLDETVPSSEPASALRRQLFMFDRLSLSKGEMHETLHKVPLEALELANEHGDRVVYGGKYLLSFSLTQNGQTEANTNTMTGRLSSSLQEQRCILSVAPGQPLVLEAAAAGHMAPQGRGQGQAAQVTPVQEEVVLI